MSRIKRIQVNDGHHCFIVDACVLADAAIATTLKIPESDRQAATRVWWDRLYMLAQEGKSTIYIPDICIAEAFKVIGKKAFCEGVLTGQQKGKAEKLLSQWVSIDRKILRKTGRAVPVHDISTNRDIIISVDRFLEIAMKNKCQGLSIPDLIVAATAKYLIDFYNFRTQSLHVVTNDQKLAKLIRMCAEFTAPIEPNEHKINRILVQSAVT